MNIIFRMTNSEFNSSTLYSESRQVAPPSKDFVSVQLTSTQLTLHHWRISSSSLRLANASSSTQTYKASVEDFLIHGDLEDKVTDFFGPATLDTLRQRARGEIDHLNRLPEDAKLALLLHLPIEYIPSIRVISKMQTC